MSDSDTIQAAYADTLTRLFAVYFEALVDAAGNKSAAAIALTDFSNGVALARTARDQALAAVQAQSPQPV